MTNEERAKITGSTRECLRDFSSKQENPLEAFHVYLKRYPRTNHATGTRWFYLPTPATFPQSDHLIQMQAFLTEQGYQLSELHGLPEYVHAIRKQVALENITVGELVSRLKYRRNSQVNQLLAGKVRIFREPQKTAIKKYLTSIGFKPNGVPAEITVVPEPTRQRRVEPKRESKTEAPPLGKAEIVRLTAIHLRAILPLVEAAASDLLTAEEREEIRHLAGSETAFRAGTYINQLCSERARAQLSTSTRRTK